MGIVNKNNALYMATGIDNSGLYSGKEEAIGILKAMSREVTSFDVFGGIGISAGVAFAKAAASAYDFEKRFQKSMLEVATLSKEVEGSLTDYMNKVMDIIRDVPVAGDEAAKALYQIVSAGHDGADGMKILEVSAKAAVGGLTETATAADAMTTILNAYGMNANQAASVSDKLFTTVKLGKTTFGELGTSIAQAAPIAASFGINLDDILAAVASITKQGVPTSEAMTKIRAAILGTANQLGDAAFKGRTFQEALQLIYDKAGGSSTKMKELLGTDEALQAALMITGKNAQNAANDLDALGNSAGAAEEAFQKMMDSTENQLKLLGNNITAALRPMGEAILKEVSDVAKAFNEAFDTGNVPESMRTLGDLIVIVTSAMVGYKGSIIAVTTAKTAYHAITTWIIKQKAIEAANLVLTKGLYAAEATMIAKNTGMHILLTNALKAQFAATLKASGALLTNPYVLAAAGVAALGYAIYKYVTRVSEAEKVTREYNESKKRAIELEKERKQAISDLLEKARDESKITIERQKALLLLKAEYKGIFEKYDLEKLKLTDILELKRLINEEDSKRSVQSNRNDLSKIEEQIKGAQWGLNLAKQSGNRSDEAMYKEKLDNLRIQRNLVQQDVNRDEVTDYIANLENLSKARLEAELKVAESEITKRNGMNINGKMIKGDALKDIIPALQTAIQSKEDLSGNENMTRNKAYWEKKKEEAEKARDALGVEKQNSEDWNKYQQQIKEAQANIDKYSIKSNMSDTNTILDQKKKISELQKNQTLERIRQQQDLENQVTQSKIDAMDAGTEKELAQREFNNRLEIQAIQRQKEDYIHAYTRAQKELFDAQEDLKAKQNKSYVKKSFDSSSVSVDTSAFDSIISNTSKKQQNDKIREQEDAWNEYLIKFGDYQQKRKAIIEKYDRAIKEAGPAGDAAILEKEKANALDELDNSVKNSTTLMGQLFADASQKSVNEIQKIIDRAELLMDYLAGKKDNNGNIAIGGVTYDDKSIAKVVGISDNTLQNLQSSPEDVEALTNAIKKLKSELGSKSPFKLFETQIDDAIKKIRTGGKDNLAQGITDIGNAIVSFSPSIKQFGSDLASIFGEELNSDISNVIDGISGLGQTASGIGQIMSGDIVGGVMSAVSGVSQVVNAMGSLFGPDGTAYYEKIKEQLEAINSVYDRIIDKSKENITFGGGLTSIDAASTALDNYEKKLLNLQKIADASGRAGASWNHHSAEWHSNKNVGSDNFAQMSEIIGKSIKSMDDLYYLSGDELYLLMSKMPEAWSAIDSRIRENLESIVDCKDEANELKDALNEAITGVSYDSFYSGFIDQLSDMETSYEDMCDNFEEYLRKSMMAGLVAGQYKDQIRKLYDSWVAAGSDQNYTKEEIQELRNARDELLQSMITERDNMAEIFGWESSSSSTSQSSTRKGYETMSQDTGNEISGRLTAVYEGEIRMENQAIIQTGIQQDIMKTLESLSNFNYTSTTEIRDMMNEIIDFLYDLKKDTAHLYFIRESLVRIDNNTKGLTSK